MELLPDKEFNEELERTMGLAKTILELKPIRDFIPTLVVLGKPASEQDPRKAVTVAAMPNFDMNLRYETLDSVGMKFGEEGQVVRAIYFVTEAWVSSRPKDQPRKYALPEQDPERKEVIQIAGLSYDGRCCAARVKITRDQDNQMVAGETELMPYGGDIEIENNLCKAFFRGFVRAAVEGLMKA